MPRKRSWILELSRIQKTLEAVETPVIDRACVEWVFGAKPDREFRPCVARYNGDSRLLDFSCCDQSGAEGGAANSRRPAAPPTPRPEVVAKAMRRRFTAEYKLVIVEQAHRAADPGEIGALLWCEGLYSSHLAEWRRMRAVGALSALSNKRGRKPTRNPLAGENQQLKAKVVRLDKRLGTTLVQNSFWRISIWTGRERLGSPPPA